jgi:hypothetical protein
MRGALRDIVLRTQCQAAFTPQTKKEYTMIPDKLQQIMKQDGVVAIATLGPDGPHMVNTWNSYLKVSQDGSRRWC